jgi:hypothetical protein
MSVNIHGGIVGLYYSKYKHEEILGPLFIREILGNYRICKQDSKNKKLYKIICDCGDDKVLAESILNIMKSK